MSRSNTTNLYKEHVGFDYSLKIVAKYVQYVGLSSPLLKKKGILIKRKIFLDCYMFQSAVILSVRSGKNCQSLLGSNVLYSAQTRRYNTNFISLKTIENETIDNETNNTNINIKNGKLKLIFLVNYKIDP